MTFERVDLSESEGRCIVIADYVRRLLNDALGDNVEIWKVGQRVECPLATGEIEGGVIEEVDDCDGKYKENPWVTIALENGKWLATQKTLTADGVRLAGDAADGAAAGGA